MPSLRSFLSRNRKSLPALALLAGVLGIEILYLAIANPLLSSSLGRGWLQRHPRLKISYQRAWTPLPGVVVTRGLRLDYRTAISSWNATAERAAGLIVLPELLLKRFHLAGLRGSDVEFHFARLPPSVSGAPKRRGPPPQRPWRLRISSAHLENVGSLVVNDRGFEGAATVTGGFEVSLDGHAEVDRSTADVKSGRLWVGDRELARDVRGRLRASVDRFNYRQFHGRQVLPFASGSVDGEGQARAADFLGFFLRRLDWLTWEGESSALSAQLRMDHGQLQPGSEARFATQVLQTHYLDYTIAGEGDVQWAVVVADGDAGSAESRIDARFAKYQVRRASNDAPHIFGTDLTVRGSGTRTALLEAFSGFRLRVDMPEAEVPDLKVYGSYLPAASGVVVTGGSGRMAGWLEMDVTDASGNGELKFDVPRASASYAGLPLSGALAIRTPLRKLDFAERRFDIGGTEVNLTGVCAGDCVSDEQTGWWARVKLEQASLAPGHADAVTAELQAELRDSRPLVLLFATRRGLPGWVQKLLTVENLATRAQLAVGREGFALRELVGTAEKVEVRARLDFRPAGRTGQIYLRYGVLGLGMDLAGGERDLRFLKPLEWYENGGRRAASSKSGAPPARKRRFRRNT